MQPTQTTEIVMDLAITQTPAAVRPAPDEKVATSWQELASNLKIVDQSSYDGAVMLMRAAQGLRDEAEAHHRPMISAAHKSHQAACAGLKRIDEPLSTAFTTIKSKIAKWDNDQRLIEAERLRTIQAAEDLRRAEEFERELEAAEAAGAPPEEVQMLIEEAERAPVIVPTMPASYTRAKGVSVKPKYSAEVTNMRMFIDAVVKNPQYLSLLQVNQTAIDKLARALEENFQIPGVVLKRDSSVSSRRS